MRTFNLFLAVLLLFSSFALAQTEFIIGAEWLNKPSDLNYELTTADWNNIRDLGLNWGMCVYTNYTKATNALNAASSNNVKIMLERYQFNYPTQGQRWQYHPEYSQHYPMTGRTGIVVNDGATLFPDDRYNEKNAWSAITGIHSAGYIATALIPNTEQEDNKTYYVKLRMRLGDGTQFTHTPVCTVKVVRLSDNYEKSAVIYADQFTDYSYKEIPALSFYKTSTGSLLILNAENELEEIQQEAYFPIGHSGVTQSTKLLLSGTAFDYKVYWTGSVTCFLDYVIIDDALGNSVFYGSYDANINNEVNLFKNNSGLGRFKVRDEMDPTYYGKYLCAGYIENKIKNNVIPSGYPTKTGLHYNVGYWWLAWYSTGQEYIGRDIAWTQNNQSLVDIYPIYYTTVLPDDPSYTQLFQDRIQNALIKYLRPNIIYANEYSVPFWFAPQVHYLDSLGTIILREPTTMELKLMVNLGLVYGAKGINYFLYRSDYLSASDHQYYGLVNMDGTPRRTIYGGTSYSGDKWETVKSINQKLSGVLGTTLINLTWQNAFSIHQAQPSGTYIGSVTTSDVSDQRYVELGFFNDASNNDYFMLVNRRTKSTESRDIAVIFNKSSSYTTWKVTEVGANNIWIVSNTGHFQATYAPGEGKLFKFEPLFLNSTETFSSATVIVNSSITVPSGKTLSIEPGTILNFASNSSLYVTGTLTANGTSANKINFDFVAQNPSIQNGLYVAEGGNINMSNSIIKNAYNGILIDIYDWSNTIQNTTIQNCYNGINATITSQNANILIENNIIENNTNYGIKIGNSNFGLDNLLIISNNTIRKCSHGVYLTGASDVEISNSLIENCTHGIYIYNSAPKIINNEIIEPHGNGIYGEANGRSPLIQNNTIIKTSSNSQYHHYQGIYLQNHTNPFVTENDIQGFDFGIYYGGGGNGKFTDASYNTPFRNNRLKGNRIGLTVSYGSYLIAGLGTGTPYQGGYNSIWGNTNYDATAYKNGTVYAMSNWWGTDGTQFYTYYGGQISTSGLILYTDPWDGYNAPVTLQENMQTANDVAASISKSNSIQTGDDFADIYIGITLRKEGKIDEAVNHYKQMIERNSHPNFALSELEVLKIKYAKEDLFNYFEDLSVNADKTQHKAAILKILASMFIQKDRYDDAIKNYDKVIKEYGDSYEGIGARFDKFFAALHYKKDRETAVKLLSEIEAIKIEDEELLMRKEMAEYLLNCFVDPNSGFNKPFFSVSSNNNDEKEIPKQYTLLGNYPNPFNPTTLLNYSVKDAGLVKIKVYDILGSEVAELVNETKEAGYHSVEFNASNLPSGVYIYTLQVNGFSASRKMLLLK